MDGLIDDGLMMMMMIRLGSDLWIILYLFICFLFITISSLSICLFVYLSICSFGRACFNTQMPGLGNYRVFVFHILFHGAAGVGNEQGKCSPAQAGTLCEHTQPSIAKWNTSEESDR